MNPNYYWMIFHVVLGISCAFNPYFLVIWFYLFSTTSLYIALSDIILKNTISIFIPIIIYLSSLEVFARMLRLSPFIPWELSKYLIIVLSLFLLFSGKVQRPNIKGFLLLMMLIPGFFIDHSHLVTKSDIYFNLLGSVSLSLFIIIISFKTYYNNELDIILRLIWYSCVSLLTYVFLKTPNYDNLEFGLGANFFASGGFGSNQVSSILGIGLFLSFYAWINRLRYSGNQLIDGIFIGLFSLQGFMTFSRGGMFVGILAIVIYFYFLRTSKYFKKIIKIRALRPMLFFSLGFTILLSSYLLISSISDGNLSLRYLGETSSTISGNVEKSIDTITTGRYSIFYEDLLLWFDYPVFGTGAGASKYLREHKSLSHTEISRLLCEHGLFGLIFILIILSLGRDAFLNNKFNSSKALLISLFFIAFATGMHSAMRTFITPIFLSLSTLIVIDKDEIIK